MSAGRAPLVAGATQQTGGNECCPTNVDITIDGDAAAKARAPHTVDLQETADLDIYVSTLDVPRAAGVQIVQEYGLISATFTRIKASATFSLAKWASDNAVEAESARAMALGKLRTKAKAAGANAVLGVKVDLETEEWGRGGGGMTTMMASGTAVLLAGDMGKVVLPADSRHCLYSGVYEFPTVVATPAGLSIERM